MNMSEHLSTDRATLDLSVQDVEAVRDCLFAGAFEADKRVERASTPGAYVAHTAVAIVITQRRLARRLRRLAAQLG